MGYLSVLTFCNMYILHQLRFVGGFMKKKLVIMLGVIFLLTGTFGLTSCGAAISSEVEGKTSSEDINLTPSETIKDGAYVITDTSWESYVRRWAMSVEHLLDNFDEDWIQRAINESLTVEDTNGLFLSPPSKKSMWVAVLEGEMTVSTIGRKVYNFFLEGDMYQGESFDSHIQFKLNNNILRVLTSGIEIQYLYDSSYIISDNVLMLDNPTHIEYTAGGEDLNFVFFQWNYTTGAGTLGACAEIKKAGQEEFVLSKIVQAYQNTFVVQFERNDFEEGTNSVRFKNLGGPIMLNNPNQILTSVDSEYVIFDVIVDVNNNVNIIIVE